MRVQRRFLAIAACVWLLGLVSGCGGGGGPPPADPAEEANRKVAVMKRLAEEMAKNPNGENAAGALEEFRNVPFDQWKFPTQAEEIRDIYRKQIQGKYKGFVAQEVQNELGQFLSPKHAK